MDVVLFAVVFAVARLVPSLLKAPFPPFPQAHVEDAFTLLPPLVLVPLFWWLLRTAAGRAPDGRLIIAFLVLTTIWVDAHGLHDAANAIDNLMHDDGSDAYKLTYFLDEHASHYLWDGGTLALSALLAWTERRYGGGRPTSRAALVGAGLLYGVTWSIVFDESQTVPLGLAFCVAFVATWLILARRARPTGRLLTFFGAGYGVALVLLVAWGIYWRGFPQLSDLGLI